MSGLEFAAVWAIAMAVTAAVVGWAFLVQVFGLPDAATVVIGVAVPVTGIATAMWFVVRQ